MKGPYRAIDKDTGYLSVNLSSFLILYELGQVT